MIDQDYLREYAINKLCSSIIGLEREDIIYNSVYISPYSDEFNKNTGFFIEAQLNKEKTLIYDDQNIPYPLFCSKNDLVSLLLNYSLLNLLKDLEL